MLTMIFLLRILPLSHNVSNDRAPNIMFEDIFREKSNIMVMCKVSYSIFIYFRFEVIYTT